MKSSLLALLVLCAFESCQNAAPKDLQYEKLALAVGQSDSLNKYQHFLIISSAQCAGCVQEWLSDFIQESTPVQKAATLVVMDTIYNHAYPLVKQHLNMMAVKQVLLEQAYPICVNIIVVNRKGEHVVSQYAYDSTGDSTHILDHYPQPMQ
ncbi:MAG: hypothetical protein JST06_00820 [Bacteroidetes bacterium]|nr:hypothetical protein [Bacteroidota bacterium]MBS1630752.1 hypothetical protein [Bacteroidota bacterium]